MKKIVLATNNENKVREIKHIIEDIDLEILTKKEVGLKSVEVEETEDTLEGNSLIKANALKARLSDEYIVVADDTGLFVDALNGEPGVNTSRYGGEEHNDEKNNAKLLKNLEGLPMEKRSAKFRTVIAIVEDGKEPAFVEGECKGHIATEKRGDTGFGYDPVFIPENSEKTFSQMTETGKNKVSHRRRAIEELNKYLKENYPA